MHKVLLLEHVIPVNVIAGLIDQAETVPGKIVGRASTNHFERVNHFEILFQCLRRQAGEVWVYGEMIRDWNSTLLVSQVARWTDVDAGSNEASILESISILCTGIYKYKRGRKIDENSNIGWLKAEEDGGSLGHGKCEICNPSVIYYLVVP